MSRFALNNNYQYDASDVTKHLFNNEKLKSDTAII